MEVHNPVPFQELPGPSTIFLIYRTEWFKFFNYRKWRCREQVDLLCAHSTLEAAYGAVLVDFKHKVIDTSTRWLPELLQLTNDNNIEQWPPEQQVTYINEFMMEKRMEDDQVDIGWTYRIANTLLYHCAKNGNVDLTAGDTRAALNHNPGENETIPLVDEKKASSIVVFDKENFNVSKRLGNCPAD